MQPVRANLALLKKREAFQNSGRVSHMLSANSILQNRYRIVRQLGAGGMGTVYEAIDQRVSCVVALKQTLLGTNAEAREAFQREAALLANLRHASLPKVMDYFGEGDGEFLVMEYIAGHDLAALLDLRGHPFPQEQVVHWADQILKLLEYLHSRQPPIVHRDIKPANLKVTDQGELFLLDFGLAKGATGQMPTVQTDRSVYGYTPVYAPLEQIHGRGTDPRSDLYALGATLYHLLTGQAPLGAPARFDAIENDQPDPLKSIAELNPQIDSSVAGLIQNAMALSRRDRPESAADMRQALRQAMRAVTKASRGMASTIVEELAEPETEQISSRELHDARDSAEAALLADQCGRSLNEAGKPLYSDKDVHFTVYAPQKIKPDKIYTLLAFAHLSKRRAAEDEPDPIEEMKEQAARILGKQREDYTDVNEPSRQEIPLGGELTFVPVVPGVTFSPARRSFNWRKSVHREEFDIWASRDVDGQTLSGRLTVFLGSIIIAEVALTITVDSRALSSAEKISLEMAQSARRLRQIFAAYSDEDAQVVDELAYVAPIFGARYLIDRTHLEPGEDKREGVQRLIRGADMVQLFWSTNSMRSPQVASEIDYAISLRRRNFILPTYWEEPIPRSAAEGLPPQEIDRLHFYRIYPGTLTQMTVGGTVAGRSGPIAFGGAADAPTVAAQPARPEEGAVPLLMAPNSGPSPTLETIRTPQPPPVYAPQFSSGVTASAPRKSRWGLTPVLGAVALVLLAVGLTPIWFMMSTKSTLSGRSASVNSNSDRPTSTVSNSQPGFINSVGIEFVHVPPGKFMMGSTNGNADEKPVHQVTINYSFYTGKYEVTEEQWQAVMGNNPSNFKDCPNCPVEQVSWDDAQKFVQRVNQMNDGYTYRLPTEAEWEYACRAGTTGEYAGNLSEMAWYSENSGNKTHPVGGKRPNDWGLYDMHGSVSEWCEDWYHETYYGTPTDGSAWLSGGKQMYRVLRGGSRYEPANISRSAYRAWDFPADRNLSLGFRVVAVR